ncbi:unnamed protein product [Schistosoma mattheei]|uniref:Uncharacterized protein n=1 Tax=Schistosoma mattheei TaxID=31246 RepID=A0A183NR32_9TREM|nr:unnamed protein product [Schistosoma mattheei]
MFAVTATSAFSASAGMFSGPTVSALLICLVAMLISSIVGGPTSIGRPMGAASMLDAFSGVGRFKSSLKCSTHLIRCSSMLLITLPSLLFTGRSGLR